MTPKAPPRSRFYWLPLILFSTAFSACEAEPEMQEPSPTAVDNAPTNVATPAPVSEALAPQASAPAAPPVSTPAAAPVPPSPPLPAAEQTLRQAAQQSLAAIQPGLWEFRLEWRSPGIPLTFPSNPKRRCLSEQDIRQNKHLLADQGKHACTFANVQHQGERLIFDFTCTPQQGTLTGHTKGTVNAQRVELETHLKADPPQRGFSEIFQTIRAQRLGECTP